MNRLPFATYLLFCAAILGAVLLVQPGWGFMDDYGLRDQAASFFKSDAKLSDLGEIFRSDVNYGRFRPFYYVWALISYGIFQHSPLLFNLVVTAVCLLCLPVWGKAFQLAYGEDDPKLLWTYPLSFFVFTPFWNMFMYLSIQERFFLILGGLGLVFFLVARRRGRPGLAVLSAVCLLLLSLAKETGISIMAAVGLYAALDLTSLSREKRVNGTFVAAALLLAVPLVLFLARSVIGGEYPGTERYAGGSAVSGLMTKLRQMPLIVKGILAVAAAPILLHGIARSVPAKVRFDSAWLLFPLGLAAYVLLLLPWGYPTYMLSPVTMFLFGTLYYFVRRLPVRAKAAAHIVLVTLSLFVVVFNNVPAIGAMADKRAMADFARGPLAADGVFALVPSPLEEAAETLKVLSGGNVEYVAAGVLDPSRLKSDGENWLIMSDECGPLRLQGLRAEGEVFRNETWLIRRLVVDEGNAQIVKADFPIPFFKKIKKAVRSL